MPSPLRNSTPLTFKPRGLSDAIDGTNAPPGAMTALANLYEDPANASIWICRPAATPIAGFPGSLSSPGFVSGRLVVGDIEYGTIKTARNTGHDEPYAFNLASNTLLTVAGITSANTPAAPAASGDWTPPILARVGSRVIVCHPGFPGGGTKFGWFDVSGAVLNVVGDTASGLAAVCGMPNTLGVQPGLLVAGTNIPADTVTVSTYTALTNPAVMICNTVAGSPLITVTTKYGYLLGASSESNVTQAIVPVSGPGIPAGAFVTAGSVAFFYISQNATATQTGVVLVADNSGVPVGPGAIAGVVNGTTTIAVAGGTAALFVGMQLFGAGLAVGTATTITAVGANSITVSDVPAQASGAIFFSVVGSIITLSQAATGAANVTTFTLTGGTAAAPLWGAGDTAINPLPSVPVGVAQMAGRAYFACGTDGIAFSDSLLPCQRSDAIQALTTGDGLAVTAIGPLLLGQPLTGGLVQALIAFEGASKMQQISGDPATNNLQINALPVATGTMAPLSVIPCSRLDRPALAFVSPDGMRTIGLDGSVSSVIGLHGVGLAAPFAGALHPSRIAAAANVSTLRVSLINAAGTAVEYWYDLERDTWCGPHSFPASLIQPWRATFVTAPAAVTASLWQSDPTQGPGSVFTENGVALSWTWQPVPLPDTGALAENALVEGLIAAAASANQTVTLTAADFDGAAIDSITVAPATAFSQAAIDPSLPWVFKQLRLAITGSSNANIKLGNLYLRYEQLGYRRP